MDSSGLKIRLDESLVIVAIHTPAGLLVKFSGRGTYFYG